MIKASDVKNLRDLTNVGMMECKKALLAANGNRDEAIKILKEKGLAISAKRANKETNEGTVFIRSQKNNNTSTVWMIKICCETDFVAKNDNYTNFAKIVGDRFVTKGEKLLENDDFKSLISETVAKTGEKIEVVDPTIVISNGLLESYLHANKKIGVIIELQSDKKEVLNDELVHELAKDLCLQIAAMDPVAISMINVSETIKNEQKEIFLKQMENDNKPAEIKDKIVAGKMNKYFSEKCLLEMEYVKDSGSVKKHINEVAKKVGANIEVKQFKRAQIGN